MSEETVDTSSDTTDSPLETQDTGQDNNRDTGKPAGYHPVDLSDLPEDKQKELDDRISYLYRQVKDSSRVIGEYRTVAQQQSDKIDELMNGMGQVVNHLHTKSVAETEAQITQEMDAAFEAGDIKTYRKTQKQLIDLGIKQQLAAQQKPQAPQTQTRQQAFAGVQTQQNNEPSAEDTRLVSAWQDETNERGEPLRPWTKTQDMDDPDPDFLKALAITKRVWSQNPNRSAKDNLAEVDRQMGIKQTTGGQNVMGGSLTTRGKQSKLTLSPNQERIAVKTKFGANKGAKSDAEYITAYRKQIESVQSKTKGGR